LWLLQSRLSSFEIREIIMKSLDLTGILGPDEPLIVVDGGARNGPQPFPELAANICFHCFEPSPQSTASVGGAITETARRGERGEMVVYPVALAERSGTQTLHMTRGPGSTSCLRPSADVKQRFPLDLWSDSFEVVKELQVPSVSLADLAVQADLNWIDFLKLDTQGSELAILQGMGERLRHVGVIETEMMFLKLYDNQPAWWELAAHIEQHGFQLVDLQWSHSARRFHVDPALPPRSYRLVWGDAVFVSVHPGLSDTQRLRQAIFLASLGYLDPALDLAQKSSASMPREAEKVAHFVREQAKPVGLRAKAKRVVERALNIEGRAFNWKRGKPLASPHRVGNV
jgi:FkbM family methyltransferase